ncbi:MAG: 16S rRNA processing protein RimM [Bacteroidia bacterium]|nr:16S rRNA processing protein RimM [Bacteroidia bacterium]
MTNLHPEHFQLGTLIRTHGVKGDLIAALESDSPGRYKQLKLVYLEVDDVLKEYNVTKISIREKERSATLHLQGIEDMSTAENYLKHRLFLPLSSLPKLRGKKFYFHEVLGFEVVDKRLGKLGPVTTIYDRAEQPVLEFEHQGHKALFPVHDKLIVKIDREAREFHVQLPEGLLDIYLEE